MNAPEGSSSKKTKDPRGSRSRKNPERKDSGPSKSKRPGSDAERDDKNKATRRQASTSEQQSSRRKGKEPAKEGSFSSSSEDTTVKEARTTNRVEQWTRKVDAYQPHKEDTGKRRTREKSPGEAFSSGNPSLPKRTHESRPSSAGSDRAEVGVDNSSAESQPGNKPPRRSDGTDKRQSTRSASQRKGPREARDSTKGEDRRRKSKDVPHDGDNPQRSSSSRAPKAPAKNLSGREYPIRSQESASQPRLVSANLNRVRLGFEAAPVQASSSRAPHGENSGSYSRQTNMPFVAEPESYYQPPPQGYAPHYNAPSTSYGQYPQQYHGNIPHPNAVYAQNHQPQPSYNIPPGYNASYQQPPQGYPPYQGAYNVPPQYQPNCGPGPGRSQSYRPPPGHPQYNTFPHHNVPPQAPAPWEGENPDFSPLADSEGRIEISQRNLKSSAALAKEIVEWYRTHKGETETQHIIDTFSRMFEKELKEDLRFELVARESKAYLKKGADGQWVIRPSCKVQLEVYRERYNKMKMGSPEKMILLRGMMKQLTFMAMNDK